MGDCTYFLFFLLGLVKVERLGKVQNFLMSFNLKNKNKKFDICLNLKFESIFIMTVSPYNYSNTIKKRRH